MAKTKPIGVRFDEELLKTVREGNLADSPQKALNLYERSYLELIKLKAIVDKPDVPRGTSKVRISHLKEDLQAVQIPESEIKDIVTNAEIERLTKAMISCSDTSLGRKAKAHYQKKIDELKIAD